MILHVGIGITPYNVVTYPINKKSKYLLDAIVEFYKRS